MDVKDTVKNVAGGVWDYYKKNTLYGWLIDKTLSTGSDLDSSKGLSALQEEKAKVEIQLSVLTTKAKIEQELSIARRIESAEDVEIEEYYDVSGKGALGLSADVKSETATLGMSGEGQKVVRRVFKFKGKRNPSFDEEFTQDAK